MLEQLNGKQCVMTHLSHVDPNVRYEALLAVQKLMVHNWCVLGDFLGKNWEVLGKIGAFWGILYGVKSGVFMEANGFWGCLWGETGVFWGISWGKTGKLWGIS